MDKKNDYRKGLDKAVNKTGPENTREYLDRSMSIPVQDLFSNKTEWVKEHEV